VWTESDRIGQLTAHVDQVFPAWVLHPMWPAVSRGSPRGSCHQAPGLFQRNVNGGILWVGGLYLRDPPPDVVGRPAGFGRGGPSRFLVAGDEERTVLMFRLICIASVYTRDRKSTRLNSSHVKISYA